MIGADVLVASFLLIVFCAQLAAKVRSSAGSNHTIKILSIGNQEHFLLSHFRIFFNMELYRNQLISQLKLDYFTENLDVSILTYFSFNI